MIKLYKIGGCVRDEIMGIKPHDIDFTVLANSYDDMKQYILSIGKIYLETPEFFTIRGQIMLNNKKVDADFVLSRKDGQYFDNRRPDSVEVGTLLDDQSRRDFNLNSIAQDMETGEYIDPFHGIADIHSKIIRCVGKPEDRFNEDALRLLRAIRFAITKDFNLHESVTKCLDNMDLANKLRSISTDRIRDELFKCFNHSTPETLRALDRFKYIRNICFEKSIWLKPTMENR